MRPTLATVLSPRAWEDRLVEVAADSALVRLTGRAYNPTEVDDADVIVVGTEVPWLSARVIEAWRNAGAAVIGLFPIGDRPAIELLCLAGVDQLFVETVDPLIILRAARDLAEANRRRGAFRG